MEIICVSNTPGGGRRLHLGTWGTMGVAAALLLVASALVFGGYQVGVSMAKQENEPAADIWEGELERQREDVARAKANAEHHLNALAQRLGQLQAHIIRLDALGGRLVDMAELDKGEFDFVSRPAMGGPEDTASLQSNTVPDFLTALDALDQQLDDRSQQLHVLESLLMNRRLASAVRPTGRPIRKGWISSYYGKRTDPITGKKAYHDGIDFAGKRGSDVVAVASGVVTWSGKRYGYGKMVELNHGNGLVTRYAHNQDNLVKVGETVRKGQTIAKMGSSGRSTGPHVHFEVLRNGRTVNPIKYVRARG
ncbi:MAG: M23 family metallopeptidase [Gammaproteobacteria bacterium]|nr:M23 family metallopeptidase [Gammaproteobacteria bacterium]MDJ0893039.1 M23 family metallopeptidase [Gammaproteobacteria bacterium]